MVLLNFRSKKSLLESKSKNDVYDQTNSDGLCNQENSITNSQNAKNDTVVALTTNLPRDIAKGTQDDGSDLPLLVQKLTTENRFYKLELNDLREKNEELNEQLNGMVTKMEELRDKLALITNSFVAQCGATEIENHGEKDPHLINENTNQLTRPLIGVEYNIRDTGHLEGEEAINTLTKSWSLPPSLLNQELLQTEKQHSLAITELIAGETFERMRKCHQCKQDFSDRDNTAVSCVYHPGRLRFYSCKTCGAAQYFDCCGNCSNCSEGCRRNYHLSN